MAFPRNTDFTTDDPAKLRVDLTLEHANVRDELARIDDANADRWTVVLVGALQTVRAQPSHFYIGTDYILLTPGNPTPGDSFRAGAPAGGASNVVIVSDDGKPINGAMTSSVFGGTAGWYEFQYVDSPVETGLSGWWRNL